MNQRLDNHFKSMHQPMPRASNYHQYCIVQRTQQDYSEADLVNSLTKAAPHHIILRQTISLSCQLLWRKILPS